MLTKLIIRNFKRFEEVKIELGNPVVFIGPNNSGKTTALQALALWETGVKRWLEKRGKNPSAAKKRPGVTINRRDLLAVPVPTAKLLWRDLHTHFGTQEGGKQVTKNIFIDIIVEGIFNEKVWQCGLEFYYANEESFYCRPVLVEGEKSSERMDVPEEAGKVQIAFLTPMSGLAAQETRLDPGAIKVRIGEGRTAEVLRNLCHQLAESYDTTVDGTIVRLITPEWDKLVEQIDSLFGARLNIPEYIAERGEILMSYKEKSGTTLDLSAAGTGQQQTLLLLAYMYANQGAVLLLDEPDAHLEILRQRQIYQLVKNIALSQGNQLIVATHSEVILDEAAEQDVLIAFVGKPHRSDNRGSQVRKSLTTLAYDQYYQAEEMGWVLYLEGSTDLAILQSFAKTLEHEVTSYLERPFVHYVADSPQEARKHFYGLMDAYPNLVGIALFDCLETSLNEDQTLVETMWKRREIENYLCYPEVLIAYAQADQPLDDLFGHAEAQRRKEIMNNIICDLVPPRALRERGDSWWINTKVSDDFLDKVFEEYFKQLKLLNLMRKTNYHQLAKLVPRNLIDDEIIEKLDAILAVAKKAEPCS